MKYLLNGYYGYDNAGDEAVLCSVMEAICAHDSDASFVVTSGDAASTRSRYHDEFQLETIGRQNPKTLIPAMRACDVFVSGGGSLVQDVTSLRSVFYYTGLMRLARLMRKPVVVYAQGVGPLRRKLSQKLARATFQNADVLTLRDEDSASLLRRIGVKKRIEVTADPVWALRAANLPTLKMNQPIWNLALRSWPGTERADEYSQRTFAALSEAAKTANAHLRLVPMQPSEDAPLAERFRAGDEEIVDLQDAHPRVVMAQCARGADVMIAMRLHALIFAAAQGVACVAINYDPKVESLARLIDAPLLSVEDLNDASRVLEVIRNARALSPAKLRALQEKTAIAARRATEIARR